MSSNPNQAPAPDNFHSYVMGETHLDGDRLTLQYKVFLPSFQEIMERILGTEYGLANRIEQGLKTSKGLPIRILDAGCGEGLFLYYLAGLLEQRGLFSPATVQLIGIDSNISAIATAIDFVRTAQPTRPYLEFICHDLTKPFELNPELRPMLPPPTTLSEVASEGGQEEGGGFDFIYAHMVAEHIPNASQHIKYWYSLLKPGGIIFLRDAVCDEGSNGWKAPHLALAPYLSRVFQYIKQINGFNVSEISKNWLEELGAEQVQALPLVIPSGGNSQTGLMMLRNLVMMVRNSLPQLIARNITTAEEGQALLDILFREISPECVGYGTCIDTLARKPLA
ncbi:MAG: class I SAM-dependent methyltransferase [Chloroflexota bacterium]